MPACANRSSCPPATGPSCTASAKANEQPLVAWLSSWHDLTAHNLDISSSLYRLQRHAGNPARLLGRVRPRLAGAGRAADPRPAQDRVSRGAGSAGHRPVPEPADADGVLRRQARAHADAHRRECRIGRIGRRCAGAQGLRGLRRPHGAAGRRGRNDRARRAPSARARPAAHDHRQSQPRPRAGAGAGVRRLRDQHRGARHASAGSGHRDQLDREPDAGDHVRRRARRAARAAAQADLHGRHRRAARHRAGSRRSSRTSTCSRSTTCRAS